VWALQRAVAEARRQHLIGDALILVEHDTVISLGRRATPDHILVDAETLRNHGVEIIPVDRGGDITLHAPGQLVAYPILHLGPWGNDVVAYLRRLEEVGIRVAAQWRIHATRDPGFTGIWVGKEKLGSIGIRFSRGVTTHGVALNVDLDLSLFSFIIPCGLSHRSVTSFAALLKTSPPTLEQIRASFVWHFAEVFGVGICNAHPLVVEQYLPLAPPEPRPSSLQLGLAHGRLAC
jgi:lipoate-protein ligase B